MTLTTIRAGMFSFYLGCVIPYGEPWTMVPVEPASNSVVAQFAEIDARLVSALQDEQDRFTRAQLMLARELLVEAKMMPPQAQQQVLEYLDTMTSMVENGRVLNGEWSTGNRDTELRSESMEDGPHGRSPELQSIEEE